MVVPEQLGGVDCESAALLHRHSPRALLRKYLFRRLISMKQILYPILATIFALTAISNAKEDEAKPKWNFQVVPTRSPQKGIPIIDCASIPAEQSGFNVILTNISDEELSVWREWCSWGNDCLSFEVTLSDGGFFMITKKPREYLKNYPDPFLVSPNKSFVLSVKFGDDEWQGFPKDWEDQDIKIRAIYRIKKDDQSVRLKVWNGEIKSDGLTVKLYK